MMSLTTAIAYTYLPDLIAKDKEENPILLADIRLHPLSDKLTENLIETWQQEAPEIEFQMLVTLEEIKLFKGKEKTPICILNTGNILEKYDPEFKTSTIFNPYLTTLIEVWLSDLAFHWKSENPPGKMELQQIGLTQKLTEGWVELTD